MSCFLDNVRPSITRCLCVCVALSSSRSQQNWSNTGDLFHDMPLYFATGSQQARSRLFIDDCVVAHGKVFKSVLIIQINNIP